ncbi:PIN domain nuclease [Nocardiopsis composta]|uniref:Ribonuclease VapC n=1 Tax=Nocardiopsis composta TaxID=157465 RepID=A0A7W8VGW8_9ACTN|nr:PIN domain nuclease [Nocardiopsis composta]MBB5435414.1 hypothetical protein [Nocardiopsis composta]
MTPATHLIDTSALARLFDKSSAPEVEPWAQAAIAGLIAVCPITELEFLYSAISPSHRAQMSEELGRLFLPVDLGDRCTSRALEVQRLLADASEHRSAGPVDLLVAACAELSGLTLLHYDRDFETIAKHTGQPTSWLAEPGSL